MTYPNLITFTINDQEIPMIFNNSSTKEMGKIMFYPDEDLRSEDPIEYEKQLIIARRKENDYMEIFSEINQIATDNYWFAAKIIIYAGVVGYYLESNRPKPKYSFEQIGKLVGQMTQEELMDYTVKVWVKFIDDLGVNLEKLQELESEQTEKKK